MSNPTEGAAMEQKRTFSSHDEEDDGVYVHVDPEEFENYSEVDSTTVDSYGGNLEDEDDD